MKKVFSFTMMLALLSVMVLGLSGCAWSKTALTAEEFIKIAKAEDMGTYDVMEQFSQYEYINSATMAQMSEDDTSLWQVVFFVASDTNKAKRMFITAQDSLDDEDSSSVHSYTSVDFNNYASYEVSGDKYGYLCRVDNTMLFLKVDMKYKDAAKSLVQKLGY